MISKQSLFFFSFFFFSFSLIHRLDPSPNRNQTNHGKKQTNRKQLRQWPWQFKLPFSTRTEKKKKKQVMYNIKSYVICTFKAVKDRLWPQFGTCNGIRAWTPFTNFRWLSSGEISQSCKANKQEGIEDITSSKNQGQDKRGIKLFSAHVT